VGARGFTSGLINVFPVHAMAIHRALEGGEYALAGTLITAMRPFEDLRAMENNGTNVTVVKAALQIMGPDCGATRPPSAWPLTPVAQARLAQFMGSASLLR
jgi:4-hydroxy-tetrahydrodipicolinate synthase